jgi:cytochrome P450
VIPANTTVVMNTWAINHDPNEYDDPDNFEPDRFLEHPLGIKKSQAAELGDGMPSRKPSYAFGAGRRICAGQRMAENSMMMAMAKLIWTFDIKTREEKMDMSMLTAFKDAILTGPKEFSVDLELRDDWRRSVIQEQWKKADAYLARFE